MSTIASNRQAHPLEWPAGKERSKNRRSNNHFRQSFASARDQALLEIKRLNGRNPIISTNVPLKRGNVPYAVGWNETLPDPGVAVYFTRNGKEMCFACDCWRHVQDNMYAIAKTIEALRGIARWGTGDMMEAAFRGFTAIAEKTGGLDPYAVLSLPLECTEDDLTAARNKLAKVYHPDVPETGSYAKWQEIQDAYNLVAQNLRKS